MGSRSYVVLSEDMTFTEKSNYRLSALAAGIVGAIKNNIGVWDKEEIPGGDRKNSSIPDLNATIEFLRQGGWPKSLDVREFQPILDAGAALDQWNTAALAVVGTEYSVFQAIPVPAIALRVKKLVVWYKVQVETVGLPVSRLVFRRTAAAGSFMSEFDLEQLSTGQRQDGYLSEPQVWEPSLAYAINVMARVATGVLARVQLGNFVFEPAGSTNQ